MDNKNLTLYNLVKEVPKEAQKEFNNGKFKGTDINPMWRIKTLTEQFGVCGVGWYFNILDQWLEKGVNEVVSAFVKIELFVKVDNEWSKPIVGIGGNSFIQSFKSGTSTNDECYKMALTDAISVACKSLGIGASIYFANDKTKYEDKGKQFKLNDLYAIKELVQELYTTKIREGLTTKDIAKALGVTEDTIRAYFSYFDMLIKFAKDLEKVVVE